MLVIIRCGSAFSERVTDSAKPDQYFEMLNFGGEQVVLISESPCSAMHRAYKFLHFSRDFFRVALGSIDVVQLVSQEEFGFWWGTQSWNNPVL